MQKRIRFFSQFFFFLIISLLIYFVSQTGPGKNILSVIQVGLSPFSHLTFQVHALTHTGPPTRVEQLEQEVNDLRLKLSAKKDQDKEIEALRDQFKETAVSPRSLRPAKIIGLRGFIPGYPLPDELTIDKGHRDGVMEGQVIVVRNNIIGRVEKTSEHISLVELLTKEDVSLTAVTSETGALGVAKGQGEGGIIIDNVLLSESLKVGDLVLSKGSVDGSGKGAPPNLVVGKIHSIEKKPSALFQTAKLDTLVRITNISTVFILQ
ncbi:MAG: rod shape-determining protein MreC [Candidatus Levybacteria bacterium]|nr:rod shape-determining protein MreC [Candidatus Levybacteria bacterium]